MAPSCAPTRRPRKGIELVLNGRIGQVKKVYVVGPPSATGGSATPVIPVPKGFDYESWLGPAPFQAILRRPLFAGQQRPQCDLLCRRLHPGNIANWAAHPLDQVQLWADNAKRTVPPCCMKAPGSFRRRVCSIPLTSGMCAAPIPMAW